MPAALIVASGIVAWLLARGWSTAALVLAGVTLLWLAVVLGPILRAVAHVEVDAEGCVITRLLGGQIRLTWSDVQAARVRRRYLGTEVGISLLDGRTERVWISDAMPRHRELQQLLVERARRRASLGA